MAVLSDPIADFLTRLKNSGVARNERFTVPFSGIKAEIARILQEEGYIWSFEVTGEGKDKTIVVKNKFACPSLAAAYTFPPPRFRPL